MCEILNQSDSQSDHLIITIVNIQVRSDWIVVLCRTRIFTMSTCLSMNKTNPVPPALYRVQHEGSFTFHDHREGFIANGKYMMNYSHWINQTKVMEHLDEKSRPMEPSPFISLFDNIGDARRKAIYHLRQGRRNVIIAQINTAGVLKSDRLCIQFSNISIEIPSWRHPATDTLFLPMSELGPSFRINLKSIQRSEWLAISSIPAELITYIPLY